jgi:hypothetical protein
VGYYQGNSIETEWVVHKPCMPEIKKKLNLKGKYHLGNLREDGGCYQNVYKDTRYKGWLRVI